MLPITLGISPSKGQCSPCPCIYRGRKRDEARGNPRPSSQLPTSRTTQLCGAPSPSTFHDSSNTTRSTSVGLRPRTIIYYLLLGPVYSRLEATRNHSRQGVCKSGWVMNGWPPGPQRHHNKRRVYFFLFLLSSSQKI